MKKDSVEQRAVKIAAKIMVAAGICRYVSSAVKLRTGAMLWVIMSRMWYRALCAERRSRLAGADEYRRSLRISR